MKLSCTARRDLRGAHIALKEMGINPRCRYEKISVDPHLDTLRFSISDTGEAGYTALESGVRLALRLFRIQTIPLPHPPSSGHEAAQSYTVHLGYSNPWACCESDHWCVKKPPLILAVSGFLVKLLLEPWIPANFFRVNPGFWIELSSISSGRQLVSKKIPFLNLHW
jgi:hypothetical protein